MKTALWLGLILGICATAFILFPFSQRPASDAYDVYRYVQECKTELGITRPLPLLSCLDGEQVPIFVDHEEIKQDNWSLLNQGKKCDNPHWLGGDMGCWTYSHLQVQHLDADNILVLNCRQKGNQLNKNWFRKTQANLGMNQQQRKEQFKQAPYTEQNEAYFLYNTFNDIGLILRNTKSGKSCYLTQYGEAVVGFLPPLDAPLPDKQQFLNTFKPEQAKSPLNFPEELWYRDANHAFKSPQFTAAAGCVACHNAHGVKYSPYINSKQGLPSIYDMAKLPFLPVGAPFIDFFNAKNILQVTTAPIDGEPQLCTQCHNMTTSGTCGYSIDIATNHPNTTLNAWLTNGYRNSWMPPITVEPTLVKKHVAAMKCCCAQPTSKGCSYRKFGPTRADLPAGFDEGKGWVQGEDPGLCAATLESLQWNAAAQP